MKIDLYKFNVNNPESCCFLVLPNKICVILIPLNRCLVTFGVLWVFLTVFWVGLQCVILVFADHTLLLVSYSSILIIKIQQKSEIEVFRVCVCVCVCVCGGGGGVHAIPRK